MGSLFGRDREIGVIESLVGSVEDHGSALCVRGEAGIGKSALLGIAERTATDQAWSVLRTAGFQSEAHLPFAGLHQLLRPVRSAIKTLPPPQRSALLAAFGELHDGAPDLYLIALATLSLLCEVAASVPVLIVAEDAQWLDHPTSDVLSFVGRRLGSDRIVLLIAIRDGYQTVFDQAGLPEQRLEGIDVAAATSLLALTAPGIAQPVHDQIIREAAGNPLALVELPTGFARSRSQRVAALPDVLPLTDRLERAFAARSADLPELTRQLLLVASVDDSDDVVELLRAGSALSGTDLTLEALEPAQVAGLVQLQERAVRFHHPLVRSAIRQAATVAARARAHASLAKVLTDDPDRSAWHRAASIVGSDERVASELDAAADRARQRGAVEVAVIALERAAGLSEDSRSRGRRLLRAAGLAVELGRPEMASGLLQGVAPSGLEPVDRARYTLLEFAMEVGLPDDGRRVRSLVDLARELHGSGSEDLALDLLLAASYGCWWSDPGAALRAEVIAATEALGIPSSSPRGLAILANSGAIERGAVVVDELRRIDGETVTEPGQLRLLGQAAFAVGDFDLARGFLARAVAGLRREGRLGLLAQVLVLQAWLAIHVGDWALARPAAEEARRLAEETGQPTWMTGADVTRAMIAALRGEEDLAESLAASAEQRAASAGAGSLLAGLIVARSRLDLGKARYAPAVDRLLALFDRGGPAFHYVQRGWAIGDLAEAARYGDRADEAAAALNELEPMASMTPSPRLRVAMAYARAMLADDRDADSLFQVALRPDTTPWPFDMARVNLAYGTWLRRHRRLSDSRAPLQAAREAFDALSATDWGDRARAELRASGVRSRHKAVAAWDQLTAQELQIAQLVADGLSNREIGERLYLSHRTVASHLYRFFPKLGITSRSQVFASLVGEEEPEPGR